MLRAVLAVCLVCLAMRGVAEAPPLERIAVAADGSGFVQAASGAVYRPWGFNYVGDHGRILEEYWDTDWARVEKDFKEMRALDANVVRIHLQVGTYLTAPDAVNEQALARLRDVLDLAQQCGLYLDLTGLGCYHLSAVPKWYDAMDEQTRWKAQATFWEAIAKTCAGHTAVFCYDLMNEPVVSKPKEDEHPWLTGELGGMYFVQRIANTPGERTAQDIAAAWVKQMCAAIRKHDKEALITVGIIPWAEVWPGAKPVFYAPKAARFLDFVSVHFYPKSGKIQNSLDALATYDIGKPIVVEETFPLNCSIEELGQFIDGANLQVDGWISHYFGRSIKEHEEGAEPAGALVADFLKFWRTKGKGIAAL